MDNKEKATKLIAAKLAQVEALLAECVYEAEQAGVYFKWEGPTYGTGATYWPKSMMAEGNENIEEEDEYGLKEYGWRSSSFPGC